METPTITLCDPPESVDTRLYLAVVPITVQWSSFNLFAPATVSIDVESKVTSGDSFSQITSLSSSVSNEVGLFEFNPSVAMAGLLDHHSYRFVISSNEVNNIVGYSGPFAFDPSADVTTIQEEVAPYASYLSDGNGLCHTSAGAPVLFHTNHKAIRQQNVYSSADFNISPDSTQLVSSISFHVCQTPGIIVFDRFWIEYAWVDSAPNYLFTNSFEGGTSLLVELTDVPISSIDSDGYLTIDVPHDKLGEMVWQEGKTLLLDVTHFSSTVLSPNVGAVSTFLRDFQFSVVAYTDDASWDPDTNYPLTPGGTISSVTEASRMNIRLDIGTVVADDACGVQDEEQLHTDFVWQQLLNSDCSGSASFPKCRTGAGFVVIQLDTSIFGTNTSPGDDTRRILVFGGRQPGSPVAKPANDLWIFGRGEWRNLFANGVLSEPSAREGMVMEVVGNKLIIFGGLAANGDVLSDMYVMDLTPLDASLGVGNSVADINVGSLSFTKVCDGDLPGLYNHASTTGETSVGDEIMWIYGGTDGTVRSDRLLQFNNTVYEESGCPAAWSVLHGDGALGDPLSCSSTSTSDDDLEPPCVEQTSIVFHDTLLYVVGGLQSVHGNAYNAPRETNAIFEFDVESVAFQYKRRYSHDCDRGRFPGCRYAHQIAVRVNNTGSNVLTVRGGYVRNGSEVTASNDAWEVDIENNFGINGATNVWVNLTNGLCDASSPLACVVNFNMRQVGTTLVVFGGQTNANGVIGLQNGLDLYRPQPILEPLDDFLVSPTTGAVLNVSVRNEGDREVVLQLVHDASDPDTGAASDLKCQHGVDYVFADHTVSCTVPEGIGASMDTRLEVFEIVTWASEPVSVYGYEAPSIDSVEVDAESGSSGPFSTDGKDGVTLTVKGNNFGATSGVGVDASLENGFRSIDLSGSRNLFHNHTTLVLDVEEGTGVDLDLLLSVADQNASRQPDLLSFEAPSVSSVSGVDIFPTSGGYCLTINGDNFGGSLAETSVTIGGEPCLTVTRMTPHKNFTCFAPGLGGKDLPLVVTVEGQISTDGTLFSYDAPVISNTSLTTFSTAGATQLTVYGSSFGGQSLDYNEVRVFVGENECTGVTRFAPFPMTHVCPSVFDSSSVGGEKVTCTLPSGVGRDVNITLHVSNQQAESPFSYLPPSVAAIEYTQDTASTEGGTLLSITGSNLGNTPENVTVSIGGFPCTDVTFVNDHTSLTCVTSEGHGQNLIVSVSIGNQNIQAAPRFSYAPPVVQTLTLGGDAQSARTTSGGVNVTLTGRNFGPNPGDSYDTSRFNIDIGSFPCDNVMYISHEEIWCVTPAGAGAQLTIGVTVSGQTNAGQDKPLTFSYFPPSVDNIVSPPNPSTEGGVVLEFVGENFGPSGGKLEASVTIGEQYDCVILTRDHTRITCTVPEGFGQSLAVEVEVSGQTSGVVSERFSYGLPSLNTFICDRIPMTNQTTPCHITGSNFGNTNVNKDLVPVVSIGSGSDAVSCTVSSFSHTAIECTMGTGFGANNTLSATVGGIEISGASLFSFSYQPPVILSISPSPIPVRQSSRITVVGRNFGDRVSALSLRIGGKHCSDYAFTKLHETFSCNAPTFDFVDDKSVEISVGDQRNSATDSFEVQYDFIPISDGLKTTMRVLAGVVEVLLLALLISVFVYRGRKEIRASSPLFLSLTIFGGMIAVSSVFAMGITEGSVCHASYWLLLIGFTVMFGSLLVKNYRILSVFNRKTIEVKITDSWKLMVAVLVLVLIDVILLIPYTTGSQCGFPQTDVSTLFLLLIGAYKVIMILAGVIIAWKSRVIVMAEFQERVSLGYAIYNITFSLLVLVPVVILFQNETESVFVIRSVGILFVVVATMCFLFIPKYHAMHERRKGGNFDEESYAMDVFRNDSNSTQMFQANSTPVSRNNSVKSMGRSASQKGLMSSSGGMGASSSTTDLQRSNSSRLSRRERRSQRAQKSIGGEGTFSGATTPSAPSSRKGSFRDLNEHHSSSRRLNYGKSPSLSGNPLHSPPGGEGDLPPLPDIFPPPVPGEAPHTPDWDDEEPPPLPDLPDFHNFGNSNGYDEEDEGPPPMPDDADFDALPPPPK